MRKRGVQAFAGLAIGLLLVGFLFKGTNWREVSETILRIDPYWLAASQIPLWLSFPARVQRWTYIVRTDRPASFRHLFSATQIGFLANFVLPGRAGEAIRALVLKRLTGISFFKGFAMVGLDRVTDLFGLIAVVLVAIFAYQPTTDVVIPAGTFSGTGEITFEASMYRVGALLAAVSLFGIIAMFVLVYIRKNLILRISDAFLGRISTWLASRSHDAIKNFSDGMHVFRSPADMSKSVFFSLVTWGCSVVFLYLISRAFFEDVPWYLPFVMQAILSAFIAVPGAPGFVGQFHVPVVVTFVMLMPGVNSDQAKAAAIIMHLLQLPPVGILGVWALVRENVGLFELRKEAQTEEAQVGV